MSDITGFLIVLICAFIVSVWAAWKIERFDKNRK